MSLMRQLPQYQCHKKVWALKIKEIAHLENPDPTGQTGAVSYGAVITPEEDGYAPFDVSAEYVTKHNPQAGDYYVQYEDGYKSCSPAEAFESGYTPISPVIKPSPTPTHVCGRRSLAAVDHEPMDHVRENGTCSYCGSIMPEQFMRLLREGAVTLTPTDKNYKVYVEYEDSPRGTMKFYFQHLNEEQKREFIQLLNDNKLKLGFPGHFYTLPFFCRAQ